MSDGCTRAAEGVTMKRGLKLGLGIPAILLGLLSGPLGLVLLAAVGTDGRFTTPTTRAESDAYALVFDAIFVEGDLPVRGSFATTIGFEVRSADGHVFIGMADTRDASRYLRDVSIAEARDLRYPAGRLETIAISGTETPAPPGEQDFWLATSEGVGVQGIEWTLDRGNWTVVIMNADGSSGLDLEGTATIDLPFLGTMAIVLTLIGASLVVIGLVLVISALRQAPAPARATGPSTPTTQAAPAATAPSPSPPAGPPPPRPDEPPPA
jgi:hypothetical protein